MAKQGKALPARRPPERFDDSTLLRSAETLGRIIGALQRQLDGAVKRLGRPTPANGHETMVGKPRKSATAVTTTTRRAAKRNSAASRPVKPKTTNVSAKKASRRS